MKLYIVIFTVVLIGVALAMPAKDDSSSKRGTPSPAFQKKACTKPCTAEYKPVCGSDGKDKKSFGSICVLENYNCEKGANLKKINDGECPGGGGVRLS